LSAKLTDEEVGRVIQAVREVVSVRSPVSHRVKYRPSESSVPLTGMRKAG